MLISYVFLLLLGISFEITNAYPNLDLADRNDALEFLTQKRDLELYKRLLYTGKEQRREVKERYEEKCERKLISSALKKPRWCPELKDWPEFVKLDAIDAKKSG